MNVIKTEIVSSAYDIMWNDPDLQLKDTKHKPVLVLTVEDENTETDNTQLQKMLGACKLSDDNMNMVTLKNEQLIAWHKLRDTLKPSIVFLIGVMPAQLGISATFRLNTPNNFDGTLWLATLPVSSLAKDENMKKELWVNGMKPLFVDNPIPNNSLS